MTTDISERLPADCRDEFALMLREACDDGLRRRLCVTRPDRPPLIVDILPLKLEDIDENSALVVLDDSREFDGAYDQLKRLARRNEAILCSSMDGFFVVDADCRFLEVNEAFCTMTGYASDELLRMRITDLETAGDGGAGVPSHTRTGLHHFPTAHRHKRGHLIHLEISINVLHNAGEKILVGFARDVTERRRAEQALARLTGEQKLILDSAADGIAGLDRDGQFTFVNPAAAELLGTNPGELIGRSACAVLFPEHAGAADHLPTCPICSALQHGRGVLRTEAQFARVDGSSFPVEYSTALMREDSGVVGAVLGFKDVTEQRRAEEERRLLEAQIQQAQKLESLGLLAGGIAHDLNNTLVGVQGNACIALEQLPQGTDLHRRLQRIVTACERASKVIQQMLAYAGHVTCETSALDLNHLIEDTLEFMHASVPKSVTIRTRLEAELAAVDGDSGQLQHVITNLLVNAVEAIGEAPGQITMSTELVAFDAEELGRVYPGQELVPGAFARLRVEDTGRGMSAETLRRIFEPFFSQKGAGRGLGLSAMRGIVRAHRGGIVVDSQPGRGTRFTVVFPILKQPAAAPEPAPPPQSPVRCRKGTTVLVVDDEFEVRDVVKDVLTARGLKVLTAEDGTRAVEVFRAHADRIDVVLLDLAMPGKSGDEVLREILAIRPDARVIVSSGFIEESVSAQFDDVKPAAFLAKPFAPDTLMERISEVLDPQPAVCDTSS